MAFSDFNPAGTTRTSKTGRARHIPLLADHFNHLWIQDYLDDFTSKNLLEDNGVISGCVITQDGGNDAINTTGGEVYINGTKVTVSAPSTFNLTADGWYVSYITSAGAVIHGFLDNSTSQGAVTPNDAVIIGYTVLGNSVFYIKSFFNQVTTPEAGLDGATQHIQPVITVGPTLSNQRVTDLETTFVASLSEGDRLLFLDSTILTAARILTTESEVWMDGPDAKLDLDTFDLTFVEVSGIISVTTSTGKIILNGKTHGLVIIGNVVVEQGPNFSGTYSKDGALFYQNQIIPTSSPLAWGTETQVDNLDANFYTNSSGAPLDKNDAAYTLSDDDEILVNHNATLAADLKLEPSTSKILKISMAKGVTLNFGDAGSGIPYKFEVGSNINKGSEIVLRGGFDFAENSLDLADRRIVNNRAYGVKIKYNEDYIFDPQYSGEFVDLNTIADNPYLIEHDGSQYDWLSDASNLTKTLWRDLNRKTGGLVFNGTTYDETRSRFSLPAIAAYRFQVGAGYGFRRQISSDDPDIHSRTDINGVSVADTASFVSATSQVTFVSITDIKNGMRINGAFGSAGIPDSTNGTTILKNIDTTALTATMIDALTGLEVNATATIGSIAVTMDNSGAAGGGKQNDAMQKVTGYHTRMLSGSSYVSSGAIGFVHTGGTAFTAGTGSYGQVSFDNSNSTSPNISKTNDDETRVKSTGIIIYQKA